MATVRKLGIFAGIVLPASALKVAGFHLGDELSIDVTKGRIIIKKAGPSYSLEQLLEGVTPSMVSIDKDDENWLGSTIGSELAIVL